MKIFDSKEQLDSFLRDVLCFTNYDIAEQYTEAIIERSIEKGYVKQTDLEVIKGLFYDHHHMDNKQFKDFNETDIMITMKYVSELENELKKGEKNG